MVHLPYSKLEQLTRTIDNSMTLIRKCWHVDWNEWQCWVWSQNESDEEQVGVDEANTSRKYDNVYCMLLCDCAVCDVCDLCIY